MKIVIFGLTVSSSWGNGHATLWRGLMRALARAGHRVVFFERDVPYYAANRDLIELPGGELVLYATGTSAAPGRARAGGCRRRDGDVLLPATASRRPSSCSDAPRALRVFYDLDTPVTLSLLAAGEERRPISGRAACAISTSC